MSAVWMNRNDVKRPPSHSAIYPRHVDTNVKCTGRTWHPAYLEPGGPLRGHEKDPPPFLPILFGNFIQQWQNHSRTCGAMSSSRLGGAQQQPHRDKIQLSRRNGQHWSKNSLQPMRLAYWKYTSDRLRWRYRHGTAVIAQQRGTPNRAAGISSSWSAASLESKDQTPATKRRCSVSGSPMNALPPRRQFLPRFRYPSHASRSDGGAGSSSLCCSWHISYSRSASSLQSLSLRSRG